MAVMRVIRARDGDTLCSIAVDNGFKNCTKLRADNADFNTRAVQPGDSVKVPEPTLKQEPGATDQHHKFKRLGRAHRIFVIQDFNRATPEAALADKQRQLCISNYVTGRQGTGFSPGVWVNDTVFAHDVNASADPDHFKLQVFDRIAGEANEPDSKVTLHTQKPVLNPRNEIVRWDDMTNPGTTLTDIVCKQVAANSPWYRSHYLRLVVDAAEQNNRAADGTDPADNRSRQTLVVPAVQDAAGKPDPKIEILDLRVKGEKPARDCEHADANGKCRSLALADVGKDEKVLRVKVFRVTHKAGDAQFTTSTAADTTTITDDQVKVLLFQNYRLTLAQANVGIQLVDDKVFDVPPPRNMIAVCDILTGPESRATGGRNIGATVTLKTGNVTVNVTTVANETPQQTAQRLANALTAQGVRCRVIPNPPDRTSGNAFGSCDLLCFNADNSPAPIVSVQNAAGEVQQLSHTGGWNNGVVHHGDDYGANEPRYRFVGGRDFRALGKNYNNEDGHLAVLLVNLFAPNPPPGGILLGFALIPYRQVTPNLRPIRTYQMAVVMDGNGVQRRTVLPHEAGHVLLDLIHTTQSTNPEQDLQNNPFPNNSRLAFSEWMAAFSRESNPPVLHLRMSDNPLTNEYQEIFNNLQVRTVTLGAPPKPSSVGTFRTVSASVLRNLRELRPVPPPPL
jgi:hypothetical protein